MTNQNQTTAEKVIEKIEQENVAPIAKWHFVLKNNGFWALWVMSVVLGACAFAASIFVFLNSGWAFRAVTHDSFFKFALDTIPFFWIVSLALMIVFGYFNIRHTKRGYRFSFYLVVLSSIIASFTLGTLIYTAGIARNIDNIRKPIPFAEPFLSTREGRWIDPQRGLLAGVVKSLDEDTQVLYLEISKEKKIEISTQELSEDDFELLKEGNQIRIIGLPDTTNKEVFIACAILPWDLSKVKARPIPNPTMKEKVERKINKDRINTCEDVRPYKKYKEILITS